MTGIVHMHEHHHLHGMTLRVLYQLVAECASFPNRLTKQIFIYIIYVFMDLILESNATRISRFYYV